MKRIESFISWAAGKSMCWLLWDDADMYRWACDFGTAEDMRNVITSSSWKPEHGYKQAMEWAICANNDAVLRVLLAADARPVPWWRKVDGSCRRKLFRFINDERTQQSLVLAWIGTQIGQGWKDIMCDSVVRYIGALYETRIQ